MRTGIGQRPLVLLLIIAIFTLSACGPSEPKDSRSASLQEAGSNSGAQPKLIYKQSCAGCHAADLGGNIGPSLQGIGSTLSEEEIFEAISSGRQGMPPFEKRLQAEEIQSLAAWLAAPAGSAEGESP